MISTAGNLGTVTDTAPHTLKYPVAVGCICYRKARMELSEAGRLHGNIFDNQFRIKTFVMRQIIKKTHPESLQYRHADCFLKFAFINCCQSFSAQTKSGFQKCRHS